MNLDIETTVRTIFIMLLVGAGALVVLALRAFREAGRLRFFLKKRALLGRCLAVCILCCCDRGYSFPDQWVCRTGDI